MRLGLFHSILIFLIQNMAEKIDEVGFFFQTLVLYLGLLTVKNYSVLQAIPHSSQPVSKVAGSLKLFLEKLYLQNLINKLINNLINSSFDWIP